jgi:uncharacterized iron-regulated protein
MKKIFYVVNLLPVLITIKIYSHIDNDKRRIKAPDLFNQAVDAQIIFIGEYHCDPFYKEWIISHLDRFVEIGVNCLAIEIFPASYQSFLDKYYQSPTEENEQAVWKILYENLYLIYRLSEANMPFISIDYLDEIEEQLKMEMENKNYNAKIKVMADSYLNLIREAVKKEIRVVGIGITSFQSYHISGEKYEHHMADEIVKTYSRDKTLVLVGTGHINPQTAEEKGMPVYGFLPQILSDKYGYNVFLFPILHQ